MTDRKNVLSEKRELLARCATAIRVNRKDAISFRLLRKKGSDLTVKYAVSSSGSDQRTELFDWRVCECRFGDDEKVEVLNDREYLSVYDKFIKQQ